MEENSKKESGVRDLFLSRIYAEYQEYRAAVLSCPNAEIFSRCYEIDAMVNFYEILADKADRLGEDILEKLLRHKKILSEIYVLWLKKDDGIYDELEGHVTDEIENMAGEAGA